MGDSGGEQVLADLREGHVRDVMARLVTRKDLLSYCSPETSPSTVLQATVALGNDELLEFLLQNGANVNQSPWTGESALLLAATGGCLSTCRKLIQYRADTDAQRSPDGMSPLLAAAYAGHTNICELLLQNSADVNLRPANGLPLLVLACQRQEHKLMRQLIEGKAQVNAVSKAGISALYLAAHMSDATAVNILLDSGCDVNIATVKGDTCLMKAAYLGNRALVQSLLTAKASVAPTNKAGKSAAALALSQNHGDIATLLHQCDAHTDHSAVSQQQPLDRIMSLDDSDAECDHKSS